MTRLSEPISDAEMAVDGFTWAEIKLAVHDSIVTAVCDVCGSHIQVEPDAESYDCNECGAPGGVTSPLVKLGLM